MKKDIKMLFWGDYNTFTGFSTVSTNLVSNWKKTFGNRLKIDIVAINYFGESYNEDENIRVISGKNNDVAKDDFGRYVFMKSLNDIDYDVVFMFQDLGTIVPMIPHLKKIKEDKRKNNTPNFKSIVYFPVDWGLAPAFLSGIEFFDYLATFTEFGKERVVHIRPELKTKVKVVNHGCNTKDFFHIENIDTIIDFRYKYFGKENAHKCIIGNINRNQARKDIPTTIFGFLEYKTTYNNSCFLYLHMNPYDKHGWQLKTLLSETGLVEGVDYMFPPEEDYLKGASLEKLNLIYNALDIYLTTSLSEGWGLSITEAMACKVPVICPKNTSMAELAGKVGERAFLLESQYPVSSPVDNVIRWQSDYEEVAETLDRVMKNYNTNDVVYKIVEGYKFIHSLDWGTIAGKFAEQIENLA